MRRGGKGRGGGGEGRGREDLLGDFVVVVVVLVFILS